MGGSLQAKAMGIAISKMVEGGCQSLSTKVLTPSRITENERNGVKHLLCESMTFIADAATKKNLTPIDAGIHLISNLIDMGKLTKDQQTYCKALKAEIALHSGKLAATASATFLSSVIGAKGGVVGGGITGTVIAGPGGTVIGATVGGLIGAGGPLALGSYEMFDTVATITDLAIDHHSQCGPLAMDKAPPSKRTPLPPPH